MLAADHLHALILGIDWTDPTYLLDRFGTAFLWVSLAMIFVECGLFFPFLPGDTLLLVARHLHRHPVARHRQLPGPPAARAQHHPRPAHHRGGARQRRRLRDRPEDRATALPRDGRILKKKYFDNTSAFFDKHGNKALVIGRFVPFVRTYITVVAGVTRMDRRRFLVWSCIGAVLWVFSITLLGYILGRRVPVAARQHRLRDPRDPAAQRDPGRHRVVPAPAAPGGRAECQRAAASDRATPSLLSRRSRRPDQPLR